MKKLSIVLVEDPTSASTSEYMPGDTIAGHLNLNTSASLKYTCIKIRFVGLVSTKIAKATEEVYVLNQQVVLLGNPNNAAEYVLPEGFHSWPFEFTVPYQHIPSSGKYRHGTVKYTLAAAICSKAFLGGMQETKANHAIRLKDLTNCARDPFSTPVSITGSSNIKPDTNKDKNLASATIQLARSAYLHGELLHIAINLQHPRDIQRDPGCWIQLLRKECYQAGENKKEYTHVVAKSTHSVTIDSNTGKIMAELTIPDNAPPTMNTTKIISIQYRLLLLFDMRVRTGFMERKSRRTVNKRLRSKLIGSTGGFEVEIPFTVGTISDGQHKPKLSPFAQGMGTDADMDGRVTSIAAAASQLSLSTASNGDPAAASNFSSPASFSPGSSKLPAAFNQPMSPYIPQTQYKVSESSRYSTLPASYSRQASEPNFHSMSSMPSTIAFSSGNRSRTLSSHPSTSAADVFAKPLPSLPSASTHSQPPYLVSTAIYRSPQLAITPSDHSPQSGVRRIRSPEDTSSLLSPNEYPQEKAMSHPSSHLHMQPPFASQIPPPSAPQAVDLGMGPASPGSIYRRTSQRFCTPDASSHQRDYFDYRAPQSLPEIGGGGALHHASAPQMAPAASMTNMSPVVLAYQRAPALAHNTNGIQYQMQPEEAAPPYTR